MTVYKNKNFKRDYESTNIKFIEVLDDKELDFGTGWEICEDFEIDCEQLYKQGNKIFYGYL